MDEHLVRELENLAAEFDDLPVTTVARIVRHRTETPTSEDWEQVASLVREDLLRARATQRPEPSER